MPYIHGRMRVPDLQLVVPATYPIQNGLPQDRLLKRLVLKFEWEMTISGGAASGVVLQDAVQRLIPEVRVIGDNVTQLYRKDARTAYHLNGFDYGTPFGILQPASGDEATIEMWFEMVIDFQNNIGMIPQDSYLDATNFNTLDLMVTLADPTVMFSAAFDRDIAINHGWLYTICEQTTQPAPKLIRFQDYIQQEITATMANYETKLNVGAEIYQRLTLVTHDATVRESDIVLFSDVISGEKYFHRQHIPFVMDSLAQWNMNSVAAPVDGIRPITLTELGRINTGLITTDVKSAKLLHDVVVGAGTTMLYTHTDVMRLI